MRSFNQITKVDIDPAKMYNMGKKYVGGLGQALIRATNNQKTKSESERNEGIMGFTWGVNLW